MKKSIIVSYIVALILGVGSFAFADEPKTQAEQEVRQQKYNECMNANKDDAYCKCVASGGVKLNTNVPFIGRCINKDSTTDAEGTTTSTAFSDLIGGLSKIVVTAILIVGFMFIIIGGVQRASGNPKE